MESGISKHLRTITTDKKFSILIPTWNNLPYLKLCVESIRKNSTYTHQIVIHVNEGIDGSLAWIQEQPDIDYTHSEKNIGICYALNYCRSIVTTDYVLYMNDDMYVCPQWDKPLADEITRIGHPYFFLSATAIEPVASSNCVIEKSYGADIGSFQEEQLLKEFRQLPGGDWQGSTWPPNIVHKDIWDMAGGYSVEYSPGMYSDPDFSMKLWQIGIRLFKGITQSRVYHFGSKSTKKVVKNKGYYMFIAKWRMTSSTFTQKFLRRGEPYQGLLTQPSLSTTLQWKNLFKRLGAAFQKL
jgi:glycosyltransferase involved in cell wall biosynthesis